MTRDPRRNPAPGDRWRDSWGVRVVAEVADGVVFLVDGEHMPQLDFEWLTRPSGGAVFLGVEPANRKE